MKVVLLAATPAEHAIGTPGAPTRDFAFSSYNYAIGLLKACVQQDPLARGCVEIALHDLPVARGRDALTQTQMEAVLAEEPDVLGLSCYCWSVDLLLDAARAFKEARPGLMVVAGGPSVSFDARGAMSRAPHLDLVVRGEGEIAFVELARRGFARPWEVPNVTWRDNQGAVREHPDELVVEHLDALPSPYLTGVLVPKAPTLLLEPSRGCRFRCSFCAWSSRRSGMRHTSNARLAAEVIWAREHGYQGLNFCDTAINHDTASLRSLCDLLHQHDPNRSLSLSVFVRHEQLDQEQIELLSSIRCDEIILGLESIHPAALRECGKAPLDRWAFEDRLRALQRAGHKVTLSIMSGLPGDNEESFQATLDYLEDLAKRIPECINFVCCFWLAVLPGTRFSAMAERHGFETLARGTPYLINSHEVTSEQLIAMSQMLVERVERNPLFRCEEIHRQVARSGRIEEVAQSGTFEAHKAEVGGSWRPSPTADLDRFTALMSPWKIGQKRGSWCWFALQAPAAGEGVMTYQFRSTKLHSDVHVTLAELDRNRRCFAHTRYFNVYYRCLDEAAVSQESGAHLASVVAGLITNNERNNA